MATIGISEFTFGYAFLYEQTQSNWENLSAAPILPSLIQEQDQGWDAKLPLNATDYYYQFKLSEYLSRGNARYIKDGTYTGAYYRLGFHKKDNNRQHRRLKHLSETNPHTYYAAPQFNSLELFNTAFLSHQITVNSRIIPLTDCDQVTDGNQHHITFQIGQNGFDQHSERKRHEKAYLGRDLEALYRSSDKQWKKVDKEYAEEIFVKTRGVVDRVLTDEMARNESVPFTNRLARFNPNTATRNEILFETAEVLSVVLGVTLVLVGNRE